MRHEKVGVHLQQGVIHNEREREREKEWGGEERRIFRIV